MIHPEPWNRRRIAIPNSGPIDLPTTSRKGLEDAGFEIIEDLHPSFLLHDRVLIAGEIDRTTSYEPGMPGQETLRGTLWEPEPEALDDQALLSTSTGKDLLP